MRLASVHKDISPANDGFIRVTGIVERESGERIEIWFEVPSAYENALSDTGNPWVVAMLPYALENGEAIISDIPVDAELLENLKGLIAVWCTWYPQFARPDIQAPVKPWSRAERSGDRTAAFFSGGVDSWFTVLRHAPELESAAIGKVDDLITVHGFDIPVEAGDEFAKLQSALGIAAAELGRDLIVVRTNLRKINTLWAKGWGWLTHAAGLAVVALIMEKRYVKVLIGSSYPYGGLYPWGSHPLTDGLFSTQLLQFKHDGAAFSRVEKTGLVARHKLALSHLHVCWVNSTASNCGKCFKCIRTMAALHMFGALQVHNPFPVDFQLGSLAGLYIENSDQEDFIKELHDLAVQMGFREIQFVSLQVLRRSRRLRTFVKFAERLSGVPFAWRFGPRLRNWLVN
jgi:hypothetical protein